MPVIVTDNFSTQRIGIGGRGECPGNKRPGIVTLSAALSARNAKQVALCTERDAMNGNDGLGKGRRMYRIDFAGFQQGESFLVNTIEKPDEQFAELTPAMIQAEIIGYIFLPFGSSKW